MSAKPITILALALWTGLVFSEGAIAQESERQTSDQSAANVIGKTGNDREQKILEALHLKNEFDYFEKPLEEVLSDLASRYKVPIVLDESAADNGLKQDSRITRKLTNVSLRSALRIMLNEYQCRHVVSSEMLMIMSEQAASEKFLARYYDCRKLVAHMKGDEDDNFEKLTNLMKTVIDPTSWDARGGQGGASEIDGLLFVRQNAGNHERVAGLLQSLEKEVLK